MSSAGSTSSFFQLRDGLEGFEPALALFLATSQGRFEAYYAERDRAGGSSPESRDS
jgi:hypothetical protein